MPTVFNPIVPLHPQSRLYQHFKRCKRKAELSLSVLLKLNNISHKPSHCQAYHPLDNKELRHFLQFNSVNICIDNPNLSPLKIAPPIVLHYLNMLF
jgi:hypothetical protein